MARLNNETPDEALIRARDVSEWCGMSVSTVWRLAATGALPAPRKLSAGVTVWRVGDIRAWLASKAS